MWNWFCNFNFETIIILRDISIKNTPHHRLKRFSSCTTSYVWLKKINILQFGEYMRYFTANVTTTALTFTQNIEIFNNTSPILTQLMAIKAITMKTKRLFTVNWKFRNMITLTIVLSHSQCWPTSWKLKQQFEKRLPIFLNYKKRITISLLLHDRNHHNFFSW